MKYEHDAQQERPMPPKFSEMYAKVVPQIADMVFRLTPSESEGRIPTMTLLKERAQQADPHAPNFSLPAYLWADDSAAQAEPDGSITTPGSDAPTS